MSRENCLQHRRGEYIVIIRSSFIDLCAGDHCAASLLSLLEYLTSNEIDRREKAEEPGDPWIKISLNRICSDMLDHYSRRSIQERMRWMVEWGFIEVGEGAKGDVRSYLLKVEYVNELLERGSKMGTPPPAKLLYQEIPTPAKPDCVLAPEPCAKSSKFDRALNLKEEKESREGIEIFCPPANHPSNGLITTDTLVATLASRIKNLKGGRSGQNKTMGHGPAFCRSLIRSKLGAIAADYSEDDLFSAFDAFAEESFWSDYDQRHRIHSFFTYLQERACTPRNPTRPPERHQAAGAEALARDFRGDTGTPPSIDGLKTPPTDFPSRWNELVPSCQVIWSSVRDVLLGRDVFRDHEFGQNFDAIARKCEQIHQAKGAESGWLTFRWLLREGNWWKVASGEFDWMARKSEKKSGKATTPNWIQQAAEKADERRKNRESRTRES